MLLFCNKCKNIFDPFACKVATREGLLSDIDCLLPRIYQIRETFISFSVSFKRTVSREQLGESIPLSVRYALPDTAKHEFRSFLRAHESAAVKLIVGAENSQDLSNDTKFSSLKNGDTVSLNSVQPGSVQIFSKFTILR